MSDEELESEGTVQRPRDVDRLVRVPIWVLEDTIGLLSQRVEDRRGESAVLEEIRRRLGRDAHPAGSDLQDDELPAESTR